MGQRQTPGGPYVNELATAQRQLPGGAYLNETVSVGGATYTLTADSGSFALTGQNAGLAFNRVLGADSGSYALTGQDAGLAVNRTLAAESGSFALTGQDATLTYTPVGGPTYTLVADSGSFALAGQDTGLAFNRVLVADTQSYSLTGQAAGLAFNRVLVADTTSFALTGQDATLTYTGNGYTYTLSAETGSFALTGQDATLSKTGGGLRRYKHYRKGYLKRGNEVLVFDSEELAEQYEAAEVEAAQAINRAQRRKARIAIPKPAAKVDIAQVEIQAAAYQMPANVPNMVAALDYEQLVMLTQRIADMQDEEDLELLLL